MEQGAELAGKVASAAVLKLFSWWARWAVPGSSTVQIRPVVLIQNLGQVRQGLSSHAEGVGGEEWS